MTKNIMRKIIQPFIILFFTSICFLGIQVDCRKGRIAEGNATEPGEFKYVVFVYHVEHGICTGGILSDNLILTAAHCLINKTTNEFFPGRIVVIAGTNDVKNLSSSIDVSVKEIMVPTFYNRTVPRSPGDIALLRLKNPLDLTDNRLQQLLLPDINLNDYTSVDPDEYYRGKILKFAGFGMTDGIVYENGSIGHKNDFTGKLLKADMELTGKNCDGMYDGGIPVPENSFCAVMVNPENLDPIGLCTGDSGGPLVFGERTVIGVTSFSDPPCNQNFAPTAFTRIDSFQIFIREALNGRTVGRFKIANATGHF